MIDRTLGIVLALLAGGAVLAQDDAGLCVDCEPPIAPADLCGPDDACGDDPGPVLELLGDDEGEPWLIEGDEEGED